MTFKAEDHEKKWGTCPRHGDQVLWLVCKHVGKGHPEEIWLGPNRIAICPACSMLPVDSIDEELVVACEACIRAKIKERMDTIPEGGSIHDVIKGLEPYEEELIKDD